jgi:hypothetical protein
MQVIHTLIIAIALLFSFPVLAQNNGAATDDDVMNAIHGAKAGHGATLAPAPAPAQETTPEPEAAPAEAATNGEPPPAISDLRSQQIQVDNEDERNRAKGVFVRPEDEEGEDGGKKDDECTARDVSSAMKEPANYAYGYGDDAGQKYAAQQPQVYGMSQQRTEEMQRLESMKDCNRAYDKMGYDCDPSTGSDCAACEAAVKNYTAACSYVRDNIDMRLGPAGMTTPGALGPPITSIPYTPGKGHSSGDGQ